MLQCKLILLLRVPTQNKLYKTHSRTLEEFQKCRIIALPAKYNRQYYAMVLQKDSPYLALFNHYITIMREVGAIHQIAKKYEPKSPNCGVDIGKPLGFNNCIAAFLVPTLGLFLAMILFLLETISVNSGIKIPMLEWYDIRKNESPAMITRPSPEIIFVKSNDLSKVSTK